METTQKTAAEKAFSFVNASLADGKNVYVSTVYRSTRVTPKLAARWRLAGRPVFYLKDGALMMNAGKGAVKLAIPELVLVTLACSTE